MTDLRQFRLPDVGEGLTEAEILSWAVSVGDLVHVNQVLCEIETAKAAVELPSPHTGTVTEIHHPAGTTVPVGEPVITIDLDPPAAGGEEEPAAGLIGGPAPGGRTSVLVGYGPRDAETRRRQRRTAPAPESGPTILPTTPDVPSKPVRHGGMEVARAAESSAIAEDAAPSTGAETGRGRARPLAKPPVRKLAKDLGIDLATLTGSGPGGIITRADVQAAAQPERAAGPQPPLETPASKEQRIPVKGIRRHTAAAMVASAFTAPHVTVFLTVDVTRTRKLAERLSRRPELQDVKVTPLLFVAKALLLAVRRHPLMNSSWDETNQEIVVKEQVNLGIAAATPRGLLVPNIKDAAQLALPDLATALAELTATARAGHTAPEDMTGGTITITNVGVFGVDSGTPILNPGEAAILAVGAIRDRPWVHKGKVVPRQVVQLSLSFDHRIVDGEEGSRFLSTIGELLTDPESIWLH